MVVRAIRAEAQGICSRSPVELQQRVAYGKRNSQRGCGCSVFSVRCSVNRRLRWPTNCIRLCGSHDDVKMPPKFAHWSSEFTDFPGSERTAIRHGGKRVLKMVVDLAVRFARRADALPLALRVFMRIIRCPDNLWRDSPAPVVATHD